MRTGKMSDFTINQRSLDGGRPTGQVSLDGDIVQDDEDEEDE